jgi:HEAT repeat protein
VRPFVESKPPLPSGEETSLLLRALRDRDPFVRQRAVAALAGNTEADRALLDALRDEYPMVRREVVRALRRAGRSLAVQALVEVVSQDPSAEVREEAVIVLADFLHPGNSNSSTQS